MRATVYLLIMAICAVLIVLLVEDAHGRGELGTVKIQAQGESIEVEYVRTIDGDTIEVVMDDRVVSVRLFAVDAPELEAGTSDAFFVAAAVATLLEGSLRVWVEVDPVAREDRWGRVLGWVWYEWHESPGFYSLLNLEMLHDENFGVSYYPACQSHFYDDLLPTD